MLTEIIAIAAIVLIVGGAVAYIIKAKKSGRKCIGCPYASSCKSGGSSFHCGSGAQDRRCDGGEKK